MAWLTPWILYRNSVFVFDFDADDRGIFDSHSKKRQFITPWTVNYIKHFASKTIQFDIYIHMYMYFIHPSNHDFSSTYYTVAVLNGN